MAYCINPQCTRRQNSDRAERCSACGTPLLINNRLRLIAPLRPLSQYPHSISIEVFEVDDLGTQWHPVRERRVMKVLNNDGQQEVNTLKSVELMQREAHVLSLLAHPNLTHPGIPKATIDDYFTFTPHNSSLELHCLVMQKFAGQNLETWVESYGRISQTLALNWLKQLTQILNVVHGCGYFHRDIKPNNIILQPNGEVALIDFGAVKDIDELFLARVSTGGGTPLRFSEAWRITRIYTPGYSPLEQIEGQALPQSDFYALGRTFVYLVTAINPSDLPKDEQTGRLIWRNKAPQIDRPFAELLDDLMAPFPGQRPPTTQVILQRLERIPLRSRLQKIVKSKQFQVSSVSLLLLVAIIIHRLFNLFLSNYYFNQASRQLAEPENAKKYYELAIKYNPKDADAYNNLALVCQKLRDLNCVMANYEKFFKLKPESWEGHFGLGNFYDDLGKYELAAQQYKLAIDSSKEAVNAVSNLARIKNKRGEYDRGVKLAQQGLSQTQNPEWQAALYKNLGWAQLGLKQYGKAKINLQKAKELDPQRTDAYCLLAQVQEALREMSDARVSWEVCLLANSSLPEVQEWRQQILDRLIQQKE